MDTKHQLQPVNKQRCPVHKLKFFLLCLALFLVGCYYYRVPNPQVSINKSCLTPRFDYKHRIYKNVVTYSPGEYNSLDITVTGCNEDMDVKFVQTTNETINILSELKLTDEKLNHEISTSGKDSTLSWRYDAPDIHKTGGCATGSIYVEIPKGLKNYGSIRLSLSNARVKFNSESHLATNYLHVGLRSGTVDISDLNVNKLVSSLYVGHITTQRINSTYTYLATSIGNISIKDSAIEQAYANSVDGNTEVEVRGAESVSSNSVNGHVSINVQSVEPGREKKLKAVGRTTNGNVDITVPKNYEGNFIAFALNGVSKVNSLSGQIISFDKNFTHFKAGKVGEKVELGRLSSKTFNGRSQINFA